MKLIKLKERKKLSSDEYGDADVKSKEDQRH